MLMFFGCFDVLFVYFLACFTVINVEIRCVALIALWLVLPLTCWFLLFDALDCVCLLF